MHVCTYVCMYVRMYVACMYLCMYVCTYMYACIYIYIYVSGFRMCRPPMLWVQALQDKTLTMITRSPASLLIKLLMSISCNASQDMQTGTAALRSAANRSAYRSKHLQIAINYEYQPHAHGNVRQLLICRLGLLHTTTTEGAGGHVPEAKR